MKINLGLWDRVLRFLLSLLLLSWAIAGGPWWAYLGLYSLITSGWGFCPAYAFLNIRTAPQAPRSLVPPE